MFPFFPDAGMMIAIAEKRAQITMMEREANRLRREADRLSDLASKELRDAIMAFNRAKPAPLPAA